jgi:hypothetical protein
VAGWKLCRFRQSGAGAFRLCCRIGPTRRGPASYLYAFSSSEPASVPARQVRVRLRLVLRQLSLSSLPDYPRWEALRVCLSVLASIATCGKRAGESKDGR